MHTTSQKTCHNLEQPIITCKKEIWNPAFDSNHLIFCSAQRSLRLRTRKPKPKTPTSVPPCLGKPLALSPFKLPGSSRHSARRSSSTTRSLPPGIQTVFARCHAPMSFTTTNGLPRLEKNPRVTLRTTLRYYCNDSNECCTRTGLLFCDCN